MPRVGTYRYLKASWKRRNRRIWRFMNWWEKRSADSTGTPLYNSADGLAVALDLLMHLHPDLIDTLDQMEDLWRG
jgi:hypothetical protein